MKNKWYIIVLLISLNSFAESNSKKLINIRELTRIAFGSCNNQNQNQPLWNDVINQKPDLWIWAGDTVYADWQEGGSIKEAYAIQNQVASYKQMKSVVPIIGTWDDHDYAFDNATGKFSDKHLSQKWQQDFMEIEPNSLLRDQQGLYTSYEFGPFDHRIKIILLDNRYFKGIEPDYPILGKKQWDWLENQLAHSTAKIHFIVTGLPVLSPLLPYSEEWAEGTELRYMLDLLARTKPNAPVFLSGDKHFASIYKRHGHLEFMSSGMTHTVTRKAWPYLRSKFPATYFGLNYGQIDISWDQNKPVLQMSVRTPTGQDRITSKLRWENQTWTFI